MTAPYGVGLGNTAVDPRGAGALAFSDVPSWILFYLPFNVTITRYRFQVDATAADAIFFAGMYTSAGALVFDIGAVAIANTGQYGPGATHDPATVFFDSGRNATSAVALTAGWYLYGWGCRTTAATGTIHLPSAGPSNALWAEQIALDTVGLPTGLKARMGKSGGFDLSGQTHMPLALGLTGGTSTTSTCPCITFFA